MGGSAFILNEPSLFTVISVCVCVCERERERERERESYITAITNPISAQIHIGGHSHHLAEMLRHLNCQY